MKQGEPPDDLASGETRVDAPTESGTLIAGRYRIREELGRGGIGVVYLASDEQLEERPVVVKVLLDESTGSEWLQKKFRDEIKALVRIDHPGVVGALDAGVLGSGRPFLVMQHVQGVTLRAAMRKGDLPPAAIADIVRQMGQALSAAHERGVFHRDLKPENVMLQDLGRGERLVKIIDFGIATVKDKPDAETRMTQVAGTVLYMAPEQLAGRPGAASDTWALAVIAFELLSGRLPFEPSSPYELLELQKAGLRRKLSDLRPGLPPGCDAVVERGLAFAPERRPSAREFGESLFRALAPAPGREDAPAHTRREGPPARPGAKRTRALAGVALLVAASAAAALWGLRERPAVAPAPAPATSVASQPVRRTLAYWVVVQKYRDGRPYRDPFRLTKEMMFGVDDRIRLVFSSPEEGYLYIVNEGPVGPSYNVLFPSTSTRGGEARLRPGDEVPVPEQSWFVFDEEEGTEKLWLVWSERAVPELEAVKGFANPENRGVVADPARRDALAAFFAARAEPAPEVVREDDAKRTLLRSRTGVLVSVLKLEHH